MLSIRVSRIQLRHYPVHKFQAVCLKIAAPARLSFQPAPLLLPIEARFQAAGSLVTAEAPPVGV